MNHFYVPFTPSGSVFKFFFANNKVGSSSWLCKALKRPFGIMCQHMMPCTFRSFFLQSPNIMTIHGHHRWQVPFYFYFLFSPLFSQYALSTNLSLNSSFLIFLFCFFAFFLTPFALLYCRNLNLGLVTKVRACEGVGYETQKSHFMLLRVQENVSE